MVTRVTHAKVSGKPQGSDPARVYGNHWDADHVVEGLDIGTDVQAHDADLDALSALSTTGILARTADATYSLRTITAGALLGVTNGDGVIGNPTIAVTDAELLAIGGLTSAADKVPYFTGSGTAALADFTTAGRALVDDTTAAAQRTTLGSTTVGDAVFIAASPAAARTAIGAVIGTDVQAFDADLAALAANSTDGLWAHTGAGTGAARTLAAPAAGLAISNPAGVAGNPTFALANDLSALEALASTGIAARTATDTWAQRTITGTANEITLTNGDGVSGNPTASLPSSLTFTGKAILGGTFTSPTLVTPDLGVASATSLLLTSSAPFTATGVNANFELGTKGTANTPFIDFNSSGNSNDYDARMIATGGGVGSGLGTIVFSCGSLNPTGTLVVNGETLTGAQLRSNSATGGVGYASGAGGTVTQATSKSTTVVLNKVCGAITLNNASLGAATIVSFTLTNSAIAATDVLVLNHISGGTIGAYTLNAQAGAGSATINVRNATAGALGEAVVIQFAVVKAVNA